MEFKLGELFSGPGGLALAAGWAGKVKAGRESYSIKHAWGVDKDEQAINTYRFNIVKQFGGCGICKDAIEFCNEIAKDPEKYKINALAFGFPCNDYSNVGEKRGLQGKYGNLYKAGIAVINQYNPHWFIAENVSGIHSADSGETFLNILHELEKAGNGYRLTVNLYKFEQYGIPQLRHRYIIVGIRNDYGFKFDVPEPTHDNDLKSFVTAGEALQKIKSAKANCELTKQHDAVIMRLKFTPPWHNAWYLDDLLKMSLSERRETLRTKLPWYGKEFSKLTDTEILEKLNFARLKCEKARMSHIYKRLDAKKPSYTITGSGGGGTHVYHWKEHRALTNRERAKLQSFPNTFEFQGSKEEVRKQIGMAVPPKGAKIIFQAILKKFAGIEYKSVPPSLDLESKNAFQRLMELRLEENE